MVATGVGVYFLQQLMALIPGDTPHEYDGRPTLVELTVNEDKCFVLAGDAPGLGLVGRELPLDYHSRMGKRQSGSSRFTFGGSSIAMTSGLSSSGGFSPSSRMDG
jgi:hypothetical protein